MIVQFTIHHAMDIALAQHTIQLCITSPYSNAIASPGCVFLGTRHNVTTPVCFKVILASRFGTCSSPVQGRFPKSLEAGFARAEGFRATGLLRASRLVLFLRWRLISVRKWITTGELVFHEDGQVVRGSIWRTTKVKFAQQRIRINALVFASAVWFESDSFAQPRYPRGKSVVWTLRIRALHGRLRRWICCSRVARTASLRDEERAMRRRDVFAPSSLGDVITIDAVLIDEASLEKESFEREVLVANLVVFSLVEQVICQFYQADSSQFRDVAQQLLIAAMEDCCSGDGNFLYDPSSTEPRSFHERNQGFDHLRTNSKARSESLSSEPNHTSTFVAELKIMDM
ncbi:hypothetical protein KCU83_g136, partial [Aureobasidium melanogenum]